jgi:lipopolysaccharide transport system permease protein
VFSIVFKVGREYFPLFALAGIIPWLFFSNTVSESVNSFSANVSLLRQCLFPVEYVFVSSVLGNLLNFLIGFIFLFPLFAVFNYKVVFLLPFLILIIFLHTVFIMGLGMFLAVLNVFFKDVNHFLSIFLMVWFWVTPVFYELDMVPYPFRLIVLSNPMTYYVLAYQDIVFKACLPELRVLLVCVLMAAVTLSIGYLVLIRKEPELLKRL